MSSTNTTIASLRPRADGVRPRFVTPALLGALFLTGAGAQEVDVQMLEDPDLHRMMGQYLARKSAPFESQRDADIAAIQSTGQLQEWQRTMRERFIQLLGGFPAVTPLNPRVTGILRRDGYRIEKIVFESQPRLYVTANLYLPTWMPPGTRSPAFIAPVGH